MEKNKEYIYRESTGVRYIYISECESISHSVVSDPL